MATSILARITESRGGQRRITIPKDVPGFEKGDWVEIRSVRLEVDRTSQVSDTPAVETISNHN